MVYDDAGLALGAFSETAAERMKQHIISHYILLMSDSIKIEPIKLKEFDVKQSKYDVAPKIPFRSVILGPSGSGKTILLQNMILNIYKNCQ